MPRRFVIASSNHMLGDSGAAGCVRDLVRHAPVKVGTVGYCESSR